MSVSEYQNLIPGGLRQTFQSLSSTKGSVLVYLIVVVLIFGVLGVTIVSLFTTATTSSATPNDARRAYYMAESAMRYGMSELRNNEFSKETFKNLNDTTYRVDQKSTFEFNTYSISLRSPSKQNNPNITLNKLHTDIGEIPDNFTLPSGNIYAVNMNPAPDTSGNLNYPSNNDGAAIIQNFVKNGPNSYSITVADSFNVENGEIVSLGVKPFPSQSPSAGGSLDVDPDARFFFPERSGAVIIRDKAIFYEKAIYYNSGPERVELTMLSDAVTIPININDYFTILAPENYLTLPTGTSGDVSYGNDLNYTVNVYDQRIKAADGTYVPMVGTPSDREEDINKDTFISNITELEGAPNLIERDLLNKTLSMGGASGPVFGGAWYSGNQSIGGNTDFCNTGACLFRLGVRVFFTLDYTGNADGFTFTIMNADPTNGNDITSIGGDPQLSELLAYAGDSRLVVNPTAPADFLDGSGEGIVPPKLAVEFDAKTNFDQNFEDEQNKDYCSGPNIKPNTRNDPEPGGAANRDAVQLVYWGDRAPITIDCRPNGNPSSYDDNRHNVKAGEGEQQWPFTTPTGAIVSKPAVDPDDGTIYVGSFDGHLYAINPDGTEKWRFPSFGSIGAVESSPTIGADGTVYVGSNDGHLYAINPDGTEKWQYPSAGSVGMIRSSPAIDRTGGLHDGTIYVGSGPNDSMSNGRLFAINPDGSLSWQFTPINSPDNDVDSSPAIDSAGKIYFGSDDNTVYALNPNSRLAGLPFNPPNNGEWEFATLSDVESKLVISESLSTVYVESESFFLYAINIVDGSPRWALDIDRFGGVADDDNLESSPTIGADGTIYVGSKDGHLYAVNHNDRLADPFPPVSNFPTVNEWISFDTGGAVRSSPAIDSDRTIYIGSDVGRLFAVNPDNGSQKWQFPDAMAAAIGEVRSSPTIGDNGIIYFGSNDTNVYAINPFINPRNRRDLYLTANEIDATVMDPNNWLNDGPWAVRLEVERSLVQNANGNYDYNLQLWMRQCTQADCSNILGTFFHNTRIKYDYSALEDLPLSQNIELSLTDHNLFNRFLFGFTTSTAAGESQSATIGEFNLSFIRPADPVITSDLNWPPP